MVVVITGVSAGVGRAIAREFARRGSSPGLLARDRLEAVRQEVERLGGKALTVSTDVADPEQIESAAGRVEREFGAIDVWLNGAIAEVSDLAAQVAADAANAKRRPSA